MNQPPFAIGLPTGPELFIVLGIVILFFGASRIPAMMRGIGRGAGEFKKGLDEGKK